MKSLKKLLAGMLAICMILCLCACGSKEAAEDNKDAESQVEQNESENANVEAEPSTDAEEDVEEEAEVAATFKVVVVDGSQNPVEGVMVQMCKDTCVPAKTDADGVAIFNIDDADGYKLSVLMCPEGYEYTGEAEIYLESGATEYTIELNGGN